MWESVGFIIAVFVIGFLFGGIFFAALIDFQIERGRLPAGLKRKKDKLLALLNAKQ